MALTNSRLHAQLDFSDLSDAARQGILTAIQQLAPSSSLYTASSSIQASYAALVKKGTVLQQDIGAVASDKQKLRADLSLETAARTSFDAELRNLATLTESASVTSADLTGMGFTVRPPRTIATAPPAVPTSVEVKLPARGRGVARVVAMYTGAGKPHFVGQWSPDPVTATSWSTLPGAGRTRVVTGASGTHVWVRFATMRAQLQSDWCTPVLVTIP
jgi:hypothetical protein